MIVAVVGLVVALPIAVKLCILMNSYKIVSKTVKRPNGRMEKHKFSLCELVGMYLCCCFF